VPQPGVDFLKRMVRHSGAMLCYFDWWSMSIRSMLEFNHDKLPQSFTEAVAWADALGAYIRTGEVKYLPDGVTFFHSRHHADPCPLGDPPRGWDNSK
jgi:hypothetical protein